uniref:Methylosome subunit pICln n=1 Tax=Cacopsylla melanoneura TaxID=428564 RepID=A0A8D8V2F0_9HEMI
MVVRTIQSIPLTSLPEPSGSILHTQSETTAYIENDNIGTGTLYVAESQLQWTHSSSGLGFVLEYPRITIHAISRDTNHFPEECIYLQVEKENADEDGAGGDMSDEDEDDSGMIEIRLVPQDKATLEDIFMAMNQCQKLHPDPNQSPLSDDEDDEDEEDGQFEDASDDQQGNGHGSIPNGYAHGSSEDESMDLDGDR